MKLTTTSCVPQLCPCWILAVRVKEGFTQGFEEVRCKLRPKIMKWNTQWGWLGRGYVGVAGHCHCQQHFSSWGRLEFALVGCHWVTHTYLSFLIGPMCFILLLCFLLLGRWITYNAYNYKQHYEDFEMLFLFCFVFGVVYFLCVYSSKMDKGHP